MEREKGEVNGVIDLLVRQTFFFQIPRIALRYCDSRPFPLRGCVIVTRKGNIGEQWKKFLECKESSIVFRIPPYAFIDAIEV